MNDTTHAVFLTSEIRRIEQRAIATSNLMEQAGLAAAQIVRDEWLQNSKKRILVLAGPGNNGGDAFVVARYLQQWGQHVDLVFTGIEEKLSPDATQSMQAWITSDNITYSEIPANQHWHIVVDGLFGIGLDQKNGRNLDEYYINLIHSVQNMNVPILALDIPSGLGSDNGCIHGIALRATITVTFIGLKPGLLTHSGPAYCGQIIIRDLNLVPAAYVTPHLWMIDRSLAQQFLPPPREANSHKGKFGSIGIIGGASGMAGAALLASRAALMLGAGRVYVGLMDRNAPTVDLTQPELMLRNVHELFTLSHLNCLIVGPGLGTEPDAQTVLEQALNSPQPLVLDADALNLIASYPVLSHALTQRTAPAILTPHPAEAARLIETTVSTIQNNRLDAAQQLVQRFKCDIALKGAGSICATLDGECYFNTSGNPGLSSAGTGDVLSGIIGALIAQGLNPKNALLLAVYLHGAAADQQFKQNKGPIGMTASEIIISARHLINQWVYSSSC